MPLTPRQVTASSWLNDLRDQVEHTRILNVVYRSAYALGSHLPSLSTARARVSGAGALLHPVSSSSQVVVERAQNVPRPLLGLAFLFHPGHAWVHGAVLSAHSQTLVEENIPDSCNSSRRTSEPLMPKQFKSDRNTGDLDFGSSKGSANETEEEELVSRGDGISNVPVEEEMTEGELWFELKKELHMQVVAVKEITDEENVVLKESVDNKQPMALDAALETQHFFPPRKNHVYCCSAGFRWEFS